MGFLDRVLDPPSYGFIHEQTFYRPNRGELLREFFGRLNVIKTRKNWLSLFGWLSVLFFAPFFFLFFLRYFTWPLFLLGFLYSMVVMGTLGTVYLHRYATHHAFIFTNRYWLFVVRHLVIRVIPEETYVVSHHVHHYLSEKPGDPYNVHGGWLYCFLADVNHQSIARDLSHADYDRTAKLVAHTGMRLNTYGQYLRWGSISHPGWTALNFLLNWAFWFGVFYLLGGMALVSALFGMTAVWAVGIRTFNYEGHGRGRDRRRPGVDFNVGDLSINQKWPGMVTGEWHSNHHLYPNGARAGFLPGQWDYAWVFIRAVHALGGITSYKDFKSQFMLRQYRPYLAKLTADNIG